MLILLPQVENSTTHLTLAMVLRPIFRELENDDRIICIPDYERPVSRLFQHNPICLADWADWQSQFWVIFARTLSLCLPSP